MDLAVVRHYAVSHEIYLPLILGFVVYHWKNFRLETPIVILGFLKAVVMVLIWLIFIGLTNTTERLMGHTHAAKLDEIPDPGAIMVCKGVTIL